VEKLSEQDYPTIIDRATAEADGYPVPHMMSRADVKTILNALR
jgi:hypothetical protein